MRWSLPNPTSLLCWRALLRLLKRGCITSLVFSQMCCSPRNQLVSTAVQDLHRSCCCLSLMPCLLWVQARGAAASMDWGLCSLGCASFVQIDLQQLTLTFGSSSLPFPYFLLLQFCKLLGLGIILAICVWFLAQTSAGVAACCCNIND